MPASAKRLHAAIVVGEEIEERSAEGCGIGYLKPSARTAILDVMLDSTAIRAHQHAAGAQKKHGPQALGRSRGGFGTKIHVVVDALGNPLGFTLTVLSKLTLAKQLNCWITFPKLRLCSRTRAMIATLWLSTLKP